jgi:subtilisin family serine protease
MVTIPVSASLTSSTQVIPNDPRWADQWYLRQIGAPQAWAVTTGTRNIVVAVIDGGIDIGHPDLRENMWMNPREQAGDGIDNDGNGFVDDFHGWNFVTNGPDVRPVFTPVQLEDTWSHGTMVASLIAAKGNDGIGMAGVAWNVRIMPLVVLDADGSGTTENIIQAIRYAVNMGAQVINLSLVGYEDDPALDEMIRRASDAGVVIVAATGNDDASKIGTDLDKTPAYPVCTDLDRDAVIGVGGTDILDQKALYANFGKQCTDISAPAYSLLAARPSYPHQGGPLAHTVPAYRDGVIGTSLAAPLVSGAVALLKSAHPEWTVKQIQTRLYETVDPLDATVPLGAKGTFGYGRLNIGRALGESKAVVVTTATTSSTHAAVSSTQAMRIKPPLNKRLPLRPRPTPKKVFKPL